MKRLLVLASFVVCGACNADEALSPYAAGLVQAETQWSTSGTIDYEMIQRRDCFCPTGGREYHLVVENGVIVSGVDVESNEALTAEQLTWFRTVSQLFEEIRKHAELRGAIREVRYHVQDGYPTLLSLDPIPQAADDEVTYVTTLLP